MQIHTLDEFMSVKNIIRRNIFKESARLCKILHDFVRFFVLENILQDSARLLKFFQ